MRALGAFLFVVVGLVAGSGRAATDVPFAQQQAAPRAVRVAVYDLELSGVDERVGRLVTQSVLVELRKLERTSVIGMDEIRQMLDFEAERQMAGCDDAESCLADIAGALGADVLVTGTLARVGDEHVLGLKRIDQTEAKVTGSVSRRLVAEDGEEFLAAVGPAVAELFPDHALRAGETRGVADEVALRLNPPPVPTWVFYGGVVGAGLLTAGALSTLALHALSAERYTSLVSQASAAPLAYGAAKDAAGAANLFAVATWTLAGGAALSGLALAVMSPFVDWRGYADAAIE